MLFTSTALPEIWNEAILAIKGGLDLVPHHFKLLEVQTHVAHLVLRHDSVSVVPRFAIMSQKLLFALSIAPLFYRKR